MHDAPASSPATTSTLEAPTEASRLVDSPLRVWTLLVLLYLAVHFAALFSPSLLDDADATHANAAAHMSESGDWVTLYVNGVRYLEKPPLPYWLVAADYRVFGQNVFATHLPMSLAVLGLAVLGWVWARRAYGNLAAFYAALGMLSTLGVFLFTRVFIPEALLTLLLSWALFCFITGLEDRKPARMYGCYALLGLALLTKGLIAPVFLVAAAVPYLWVTRQWRRWRELRLVTGTLLFLAIVLPWVVLAAVRNPDHGNPVGNIPTPGHVHGFLYFFFVNEHFLRFLGKRYPHDYNKQPGWVFWAGQLVWLLPWCLYFPVALRRAWQQRREAWADLRHNRSDTLHFLDARFSVQRAAEQAQRLRFRARSGLLLACYGAFILLFFSISTNQEYYTYPAYFPIILLTAGSLAVIEQAPPGLGARYVDARSRWLIGAHLLFAVIGMLAAAALGYGLWASRGLPYVADIGALLAHRGVGDYSLSMSHFFDLTGPSFAALRLPAAIAALALLIGPALALHLRRKGHSFEATASVAFTMAIFLVAAHIALVRFEPLLSSRSMADTINRIAPPGTATTLMVYGDQATASSVIFYTRRQALLINGRSSSMIWGSYYPDVPPIFLDDADLLRSWGAGPRHFLFVPVESRQHVLQMLGSRAVLVQELSDRSLYTDRPL